MPSDARDRIKVWLDTYLTAANILKDNGVTQASFITCYADPPYPMRRVFYEPKNIDVIFSIDQAISTPLQVDWDGSIIGYAERVPVEISSVNKMDMTGHYVLNSAESEFRRVLETYPLGSYRSYTRSNPTTKDMGGWRLYSVEYVLTYNRDVT